MVVSAICHSPITLQGGLFFSLFLAGAAGSVTHCTGMCGPFVMSFSSKCEGQEASVSRLAGSALLPYHFGRTTTYMLLGVLANLFAGHASQSIGGAWSSYVPSLLLALGGMLFLLQFFGLSGVALPLPSLPRALQKTVATLSANPTGMKGYAMGLILGFLPCGLLLSAILIAASAQNGGMAALGMGIFGLATMPALNAVVLARNLIVSKKPEWFFAIRKGLTLANACALFILAGVRLT